MITKASKILILGHRGMVGSAVLRLLRSSGYQSLFFRSRAELDLREEQEVHRYLAQIRPDAIVMAAGKVKSEAEGDPDFALWENLAIGRNVINAADHYRVSRLVFVAACDLDLGRLDGPVDESEFLNSELERQNRGYSLAKALCAKEIECLRQLYGLPFVALLPATLYGPGDRYEVYGHSFLSKLMLEVTKAVNQKRRSLYITLPACLPREFLYVDDFARACLFALHHDGEDATLNVGSGVQTSLTEMFRCLVRMAGFQGRLEFDGAPQDSSHVSYPLLDCSRIRSLGWQPEMSLEGGLTQLYREFCEGLAWMSEMENPLVRLDSDDNGAVEKSAWPSVRSRSQRG